MTNTNIKKAILMTASTAVLATSALAALGVFPSSANASTAAPTKLPQVALPYCDGEDDASNCYWDASRMGDHRGVDFVVYDGTVWFTHDGVSGQCVGQAIPNPCDPDSNN